MTSTSSFPKKKRPIFRWFSVQALWPMLLLIGLLILIITMLAQATENATRFSAFYTVLLLAVLVGFVLLCGLIGYYLVLLIRGARARLPGARLTLRFVGFFVMLSVLPLTLLFVFSLNAIQRGVDSWFDLSLEDGLNDALQLSKNALDTRLLDAQRLTQRTANQLTRIDDAFLAQGIDDARVAIGAHELTLLTEQRQILASSSEDLNRILPDLPSPVIVMSVRQGMEYVRLEPSTDGRFQVRAVLVLPNNPQRFLQALYNIPDSFSVLADSAQEAVERYKELKFLRVPLKASLMLTLSLALLLAILAAFGGAFFVARRLVAPIRDLSEATVAVAAGDFDRQIPTLVKDELGALVLSFNAMVKQLRQARELEQFSQQFIENQRAYLESMLAKLSSGVLAVDPNGRLRTWNLAATTILASDPDQWSNMDLLHDSLPQEVQAFFEQIRPFLLNRESDWRCEVALVHASRRQLLSCRGSMLAEQVGLKSGYVIIFDDVTHLVDAERDAAWSEVARRLAHEIKNPLTPIQLSAERLRLKLLGKIDEPLSNLVDKSTHTIIQQVAAMKEMVDAFYQYAKPPQLNRVAVSLNELVTDVLYLYRDYPAGIELGLHLCEPSPLLLADRGRIRQLLHNLVKNALEAVSEGGLIEVITEISQDQQSAQLIVKDNGMGFSEKVSSQVYEPYVTTKAKGTGLGLAVVKKIVEEHNGTIQIQSISGVGATLIVRIPLHHPQPMLIDESAEIDEGEIKERL